MLAPAINAQSNDGSARASQRQRNMETWKQDMAKFKEKIHEDHQLNELADSIASIQAIAAIRNRDFVLEADNVTFRNGNTVLVNSNTNFISVKGNRAVVQISPSNYASGPNGVGGVTVQGSISGYQIQTDKKGRVYLSMNVNGIGISAQIELFITPGSNYSQATIYPNFNSNTVWVDGNIVPYENSDVFEGSSL
jgi:hypothetical protein